MDNGMCWVGTNGGGKSVSGYLAPSPIVQYYHNLHLYLLHLSSSSIKDLFQINPKPRPHTRHTYLSPPPSAAASGPIFCYWNHYIVMFGGVGTRGPFSLWYYYFFVIHCVGAPKSLSYQILLYYQTERTRRNERRWRPPPMPVGRIWIWLQCRREWQRNPINDNEVCVMQGVRAARQQHVPGVLRGGERAKDDSRLAQSNSQNN